MARGVTLLFAALTLVATYALARELRRGRPTALLAGALLATSGAHAVVASRVAWSHCTTRRSGPASITWTR